MKLEEKIEFAYNCYLQSKTLHYTSSIVRIEPSMLQFYLFQKYKVKFITDTSKRKKRRKKKICDNCGNLPTKRDEGFLTKYKGKNLCGNCLTPDLNNELDELRECFKNENTFYGSYDDRMSIMSGNLSYKKPHSPSL